MAPDGGDRLRRRGLLSTLGLAVTGSIAGCTLVPRPPRTEGVASPTPRPTQPGPRPTQGDGSTDGSGRAYRRVYRETVDSVAQVQREEGSGTSWVLDAEGNLVTNAHVVGDAITVTVQYRRGEFRDGHVLGTDVYSDLAVIGVSDPPAYATPLPLAAGTPSVGTPVVVIGNPYGLESTLSAGIVSGVNRSLPSPTGFSIPGAIQTDAAVNPGNSGGPMLDLDGDIIAVINSGGGENIAFGIPVPLLERILPALIRTGDYEHAYMGIRLQDVTPEIAADRGRSRTHGVLVVEAIEDAPADGALQAEDIIVALDDERIRTRNDLSRYLAFEKAPGDELRVTVIRQGRRGTVTFTLGARPDS